MNTVEQRIQAFAKLGSFLAQFRVDTYQKNDDVALNKLFFEPFAEKLQSMERYNGWFTEDNVRFACQQWGEALTKNSLEKWLSQYAVSEVHPRKVAIVMAGNIPLVGFHDLLATVLCGHQVVAKLSSNDQHLTPFVVKYLEAVEPSLQGWITFTEERLAHFDMVIATGSNNTARYFDHYFGKHPNIIRRNRNSVAVLTGDETEADLKALGEDVFRYFGLGCRNVSKLFVPKDYDFDQFYGGMFPFKHLIEHTKYANNYDYNKAVFLMSQFDFLDNGFLMVKEDTSYSSPIGSIFYETYESLNELHHKLEADHERIQCVVSNESLPNSIPFGKTQRPELSDYADGVDTVEFLLKNS